MPVLPVIGYKGEIPKLHPKRLPDGYAQTAKNCNVESGAIEPMKRLDYIYSIPKSGDMRTLHLVDDTWVYWDRVINVVEAPIADCDFRFFFTGDLGYPRQSNKTMALAGDPSTYPTASRRFGVLKPDPVSEEPLVIEILGPTDGDVKRTVTYCYTCIDEFWNESQPSTVTGVIDLKEGQYVRLKNFKKHNLSTTGNLIKYFRLYRVATGESIDSADWRMVSARPGSETADVVFDIPVEDVPDENTYVYDSNDAGSPADVNTDLGDILMTEGWDPLPDDAQGLIEFQHAVLAAFVDNQIYISEPYYYHAFPYQRNVGEKVVALGAYQEALFVATEGYPYVFIGTDPQTMERRKLPFKKPCLSARGLVSTNIGIIYPTYDGLFWTNGTDAKIITESVFSKDDWQQFDLADMIGAFYRNWYIGFFNDSDTGFIFDLAGETGKISFDLGIEVYGTFIDSDGKLYVIGYSGGYKIYEWAASSFNLNWTWKSKTFETIPTNFPLLKLVGDFPAGSTVDVSIKGDGVVRHTVQFDGSGIKRLKSGYRCRDWSIEMASINATVTKAVLGSSMAELRGV